MIINAEVIQSYLKEYFIDRGRSPNTIRAIDQDLRAAASFFNGKDVTQEGLAQYAATIETEIAVIKKKRTAKKRLTIERPLSVKTRSRRLQTLNTFFHRQGERLFIKPPTVEQTYKADEEPLTPPDLFKLIKAAGKAKEHRIAAIMLVMAGAGLRYGELQYVTAEAVKAGRIEITHGKGNKARSIPLITPLKKFLADFAAQKGITTGQLFIGRTGRMIQVTFVRYKFYKMAAAVRCGMKLSRVHPHALRHLYATVLSNSGTPPATISKLLGHSHILFQYFNPTESDKLAAMGDARKGQPITIAEMITIAAQEYATAAAIANQKP